MPRIEQSLLKSLDVVPLPTGSVNTYTSKSCLIITVTLYYTHSLRFQLIFTLQEMMTPV